MTVVLSPRGRLVSFAVRGDTNDAALVHGILDEDEYRLRDLPDLDGWALDIGAHIGTVAVALAKDHPGLRVIAVEPVPDNAALIRENAAKNGLAIEVLAEAAGPIGQATVACHFAYHDVPAQDANYVDQNRYIGNIWHERGDGERIDAPATTLRALAERFGATEFRLVKIDCEGCEWDFLAADAELCVEIIGEYHDSPPERIVALLSATHDVTILDDHGGTGIFRAVRR